MKTNFFLIIAILWNSLMFSQDSLRRISQEKRVIAVTPLNYDIGTVNGLAFGLGYDPKYLFKDDDLTEIQKVNGLNVEVNPLGLIYLLFYDPSRFSSEELIKVNGLNVSVAGYLRGVSHNGVSISLYNYGHTMYGVMGSLSSFDIEKGKGIFVAPFAVSSQEMKGLSFSAFNSTQTLRGVQIGFVNRSVDAKGVQFGLVNKSGKMKGLQIGFWNKNGKRTLPIINF
ncbi:LA_2272 family surface repeat-containing protein [Chryseobacterium sp.]|uniref:LA_2272 family surface repeat-containing protein n=1 Tax=Chryseobacterium sp. TaxID=1871047 RepID=UPI00289ED0EE|nr:hypothetical protein [Chryseobacterium sp.]